MKKLICVAVFAVVGVLGLSACSSSLPPVLPYTQPPVSATVVSPSSSFYQPPSAPTKTASSDVESVFITVLDAQGIQYSSRSNVIALGYSICDYLDSGGSVADAARILITAGYAAYAAGFISGDAQESLCRSRR